MGRGGAAERRQNTEDGIQNNEVRSFDSAALRSG